MWVKNCIIAPPFIDGWRFVPQCAPYYKGSALQNEYSLLPERKAIFMQILTHLIFLLNLLKTLINHFS